MISIYKYSEILKKFCFFIKNSYLCKSKNKFNLIKGLVLFPLHPKGWSFHKTDYMKVDSKGLPIKNLDIKSWVLFGKLDNDINIYVNNKQPIKYFVTSDNKTSFFKTDDGQNIVFDKIYMQDYSNKFCIGEIGDTQYMLTAKGKMIEI